MRIITQNGCSSVEFDGNTVYRQGNTINTYDANNHNWRLGKYGTEEEAADVFREIHERWIENPMCVYEMPTADNCEVCE